MLGYYNSLRKKAFVKLGGKCQECGILEKLQLHHKFYTKDSIRPSQNECGNDTVKRTKEALLHPERFSLVCLPCHNSEKKGKHRIQLTTKSLMSFEEKQIRWFTRKICKHGHSIDIKNSYYNGYNFCCKKCNNIKNKKIYQKKITLLVFKTIGAGEMK